MSPSPSFGKGPTEALHDNAEGDYGENPNRMGHGYAIAFGDTVFYVQETSTHVITDEDAQSMAIELARAQLDREPE
jgi:hypothetical protein